MVSDKDLIFCHSSSIIDHPKRNRINFKALNCLYCDHNKESETINDKDLHCKIRNIDIYWWCFCERFKEDEETYWEFLKHKSEEENDRFE